MTGKQTWLDNHNYKMCACCKHCVYFIREFHKNGACSLLKNDLDTVWSRLNVMAYGVCDMFKSKVTHKRILKMPFGMDKIDRVLHKRYISKV